MVFMPPPKYWLQSVISGSAATSNFSPRFEELQVELFGVVLSQYDLVRVGGQQGAGILLQRLQVGGDLVVFRQRTLTSVSFCGP